MRPCGLDVATRGGLPLQISAASLVYKGKGIRYQSTPWSNKHSYHQQTDESQDGHYRIGRFDEKSIALTANVINVMVAACLLIGPIAGFFFVTSPKAKLGGITGFTALFALCVWATTNARKAELFGATAA